MAKMTKAYNPPITWGEVKAKYDYDYRAGAFVYRTGKRKGKIMKGKTRVCDVGSSGRKKPYIAKQIQVCGRMTGYHRMVWFWHYGKWPKGQIDHVDENPLNNRIENLRDGFDHRMQKLRDREHWAEAAE